MEYNRWQHQEDAAVKFLEEDHGILEMATGTGKTRTAIRVIQELYRKNLIDQVLVIAYGNDLLEQWYQELLVCCSEMLLFRWYGKYHEFSRFQLIEAEEKILLVSREVSRIGDVLKKLQHQGERVFLILDEVHGAGSQAFRENTEGLFAGYRFRMGLSATPVRKYDEEGTYFLEREIGPVIFRFGLGDAIRKGILCSFRYVPLEYALTDTEKKKKKRIISVYEARRKAGETIGEEDLYRELARVNKLAVNKISVFERYISQNPDILRRCIVFVETREYGMALQKMLISHVYNFHTYYGQDDRRNLEKFAEGKIHCLITCRKISEGINIRSAENVVLFSSDRSWLRTTQQIGRCLRKNPDRAEKEATVVDFICRRDRMRSEDITSDRERAAWLAELSKVREERQEWH